MFYGDIRLGKVEKNIEISAGFEKHSGINDATLRNVSVGDNCLIEKTGNYINNYTIGNDCYIANISQMETTEGATFGEGNLIAVLNEVGDGNVILFHDLNSQFAAFMVKHFRDKALKDAIRRLVNEEIERTLPDRGTIGNGVKIVNTKEITNTVVDNDCEMLRRLTTERLHESSPRPTPRSISARASLPRTVSSPTAAPSSIA